MPCAPTGPGFWPATHVAEREICFAQEHPPGRLGLSDFTVADDLDVMVEGVAFNQRLCHFALAHSGWRHAMVVVGGESFIALSAGLQGAPWHLGGVPEEHRTDSLSAAFNNLAEEEELTKRYADLQGQLVAQNPLKNVLDGSFACFGRKAD